MNARKYAGIAWPSMFILVTATYGYWLSQGELVSSRPATIGMYDVPDIAPVPGVRSTYSHVWEDPLTSSYKHWSALPEEERIARLSSITDAQMQALLKPGKPIPPVPLVSSENEAQIKQRRSMQELFANLASKRTICLPVFLPGGPNAGNKEKRMRDRYAVVTALAESGYHLEYNERMSYVATKTTVRALRGWQEREIVIPIKLYKNQNPTKAQVVVLWINESEVGVRPLLVLHRILNEVFSKVDKKYQRDFRVSVIGPSSSGMLKEMSKDVRDFNDSTRQLLDSDELITDWKRRDHWDFVSYFPLQRFTGFRPLVDSGKVTVFSPRATKAGINFDESNGKFSLKRVIGTDTQLAEALGKELKRRGVFKIPSGIDSNESFEQVVLITEHDTAYGRAIPKTFEDAFRPHQGKVKTFKILKGIDGRLPGDARESSQSSGRQSNSGSLVDPSQVVERMPEGRSQYDYLKRLGEKLRSLKHPPRAIGVVGSDVYDKLLVLRALKPQFPDCIFFTTDLDAIYAHPNERQHTRNLVVASHFGLRLNDDLQQHTAPFRDSYQTATFLATRLAIFEDETNRPVKNESEAEAELKEAVAKDKMKPALFEGTRKPNRVLTTVDAKVEENLTLDEAIARPILSDILSSMGPNDAGTQANFLPPLIQIVGRNRTHVLPVEKSAETPLAVDRSVLHPAPVERSLGWHVVFIICISLVAVGSVLFITYRDRFHSSLFLDREWDETNQEAINKRMNYWGTRIECALLILLGIGGVLIVKLLFGIRAAAPLDGYTTWSRNMLYAGTGIAALVLCGYLVDRFIFTLNKVRTDKDIGGAAWRAFEMTHVLKAAILAIVFIQVGALFVCGFTWFTCFSFVLACAGLLEIDRRFCKSDVCNRKDPDPALKKLDDNVILGYPLTKAIRYSVGLMSVVTLLAYLASYDKQFPGWNPAPVSRSSVTRFFDNVTPVYAFAMVGSVLSFVVFFYLWCIEFYNFSRTFKREESSDERAAGADVDAEEEDFEAEQLKQESEFSDVNTGDPDANSNRQREAEFDQQVALDREYDRLWLMGKLTAVMGPVIPVAMGLLLVLVVAYHPLISPTPMPMGLLVIISIGVFAFIGPGLFARWHFNNQREALENRLKELHHEEMNQPASDGFGDSDGQESVLVEPAGRMVIGEQAEPLDDIVIDPVPEGRVPDLAPTASGQISTNEIEQLKQKTAGLSEGVFKPWAQSPMGWVFGGGASLALIDLWIRWFTYGL